MQQGIHVLDRPPGRLRTPSAVGWMVLALVVAAAVVATASLIAVTRSSPPAVRAAVRGREPATPATVLTGSPVVASADEARALLTVAPSAVVTGTSSYADIVRAAGLARRAHAPLLLMPAASTGTTAAQLAAQVAVLRGAIRALHPTAVLAVGVSRSALTADLPGVRLVTTASELPATTAAAPMQSVEVLVYTGPSPAASAAPAAPAASATSALAIAAATTAETAGARVIDLPGYDPRADPAVIRALAAARPQHVMAIGAGFGSASLLAARVAVAETGVQLPGGGQVLFPGRRIVALYGTPGTPALGALGQQGLTASLARAKAVAGQYTALSNVPVIPSFEIIATVAQASAGRSGTYSYESSVAALRPWVQAATRAGLYVTLDLQPGRADLLTQAKKYRSLLMLPNVGLALDPEWALQPGQLPLHQIGSVSVSEVNSVVSWLARLTAQYHLPQKLLELHEFRLTMIQNIQRLDTHQDDLAIVINMDGQGAPSVKQQTWQAVVANAPKGVFFGWKDFYVKDKPMLGPRQTVRHHPGPVLISYQ